MDGLGIVTVDLGSANSHCFDDQIKVDGQCVAFASEPWTSRIVAALAATPASVTPDAGEIDRIAQALAKASGVSKWANVSENGEYDGKVYWRRLASAALTTASHAEKGEAS